MKRRVDAVLGGDITAGVSVPGEGVGLAGTFSVLRGGDCSFECHCFRIQLVGVLCPQTGGGFVSRGDGSPIIRGR